MPSRPVAVLLAAAVLAGAGLRWRAAGRAAAEGRAGFQDYYALGESLATRRVLAYPGRPNTPTAFRGALYPGWLALGFTGGERPPALALLRSQALLSGSAAIAVYAGAAALSAPSGGLIAAWLFALHPAAVGSAASLQIESFFSLSLLGVLLSILLWHERRTPACAAVAGAFLGLSLATRSTLTLLAPAALLLGMRAKPRAPRLQAGLYLLAASLPLLPWTLRNAVQFRTFTPFEHSAAVANFYTASLGWVDTAKGQHELWELARIHEGQDFDAAADRPAFLAARARARIIASPFAYLKSCLRRLGHVLSLWPGLNAAAAVSSVLLPPGAAAAGLLLPVYFLLAHSALSLEARYLLPLLPALCVLAGAAAERAGRRLLGRSPPAGDTTALRPALALPAAVLAAAWLSATAGLYAELATHRRRPYAHTGREEYVGAAAPGLADSDPRRAAARPANEEGVRLFLAGDRVGAEKALRAALAADPAWTEPRMSLGVLLLADGRPKEALSACDETLSRAGVRHEGGGETSLALAALDCRAAALQALGREADAARSRAQARERRARRALAAREEPDLSR